MRLTAQIALLAAISCTTAAFSQTPGAATSGSADPTRFSCLSSSGQALTVWTDSHRAVVAVAPGSHEPGLPAFASPLVHQPIASLLQFSAANAGYNVRTEGTTYDLDHVLMVGKTRLSCVQVRRG